MKSRDYSIGSEEVIVPRSMSRFPCDEASSRRTSRIWRSVPIRLPATLFRRQFLKMAAPDDLDRVLDVAADRSLRAW
jgi:hypothetical protein